MNKTYPTFPTIPSPVYKDNCLQAVVKAVRAGRCVRVLGPRFRSKSALMLAAAQVLQAQGTHHVHYLNMEDLPHLREQSFIARLSTDLLLISAADMYAGLYGRLHQELFPMDTAVPPELMQTAREFREAVETMIRRLDRPLVLLIDNLNAAPPNVVLSLLNTLADLYTAVSHHSKAAFQAIIGGSLHLHQNNSDAPTRFLNVSELVWIQDLDPDERYAFGLAACRRAEIEPHPHGLETLFKQAGGDLFLIEHILGICLKQMERRGQKKLTSPRVADAIDAFINHSSKGKVEDILRQVEGDSHLLHTTLLMLEHGAIPESQLPMKLTAFPNSLDLCGIFEREADRYFIKNNIWAQLLQKHLNPARVGGFYAVNGRWQNAFTYLGRAFNEGQTDIRPALFTAVLNAMHASENGHTAFTSLAQGLSAAFPESDLHLYAWQEGKLTLFYPQPGSTENQPWANNPHEPELQALNGANYTIVPVQKELRLLIPLRTELKPGTPVGLVSLGKLISHHSPYQRQDEVKQLVSFLQQAAQIIEDRNTYANLLHEAEVRATKLNRLNGMLTEMLNHREWSESRILQLALNGITSPYGLDLNRAVLFMLNENEQCLRPGFAVGQLSREDTELERQIWLQHPPETAMLETAVSHTGVSPMQNALKRLRLPLYAPTPDLLLTQLQSGEALLSSNQLPRHGLPPELANAIGAPAEFALIPLTTGEHTYGILYVDNKYSANELSPEQFELLQSFVNQVALVLENARALVVERQRTNSWRKLLEIEETINNQVTQSVVELLESVVLSAKELFQADSVVVYPVQPLPNGSSYRFEPKDVTAVGTRTVIAPTDKPRPTQGMAHLILKQGMVAVPNVQTAVPPRLRLCLDTSTFLSREGVHAFVGIRLGPASAPVGLLYLNWMRPHQLTSEQQTVLEVFANFVAIALPGARSYQQVQQNLQLRNLEQKSLDQVFSTMYLRTDGAIENAILLALRRVQEYTNAPRLFLIRDEPKGAWGVYQLLSTGKLHTRHIDSLPGGLIKKAYTQAQSQLEINAGRLETGEFPHRFYSDSRCALAIPVKVTGNPLAILYLESPERQGLTKEHKRFLEKLTGRLALNLEQADRNRTLRELRSLSQRLADEADLARLLAAIITQALNALQAVDGIAVYHQDPETERFIVTTISSSLKTAVATSLEDNPPIVQAAWQLSHRKFVGDMAQTPQLRTAFPYPNHYRAAAIFPLEVGDNHVGCMFFGYKFENKFGEADRGTLELFAQLAALAILRARLHTEAKQRQQRLETVSRITPIISASVETDLIFRNLMQEVLEAFPKATNACIVEHLPERDEVAVTANTQQFYRVDIPLMEEETFRTRLSQRRGIAGRVLETKLLSNVPDVSQDLDYIPAVPSTKSEIAVPIIIDDVVSHILVVESDSLAAFSVDDEEVLETLAKHVALAVKNANQFRRAKALEVTKQTAMMATGLVHDINNAVAAFPDLIDEIAYKYERNRDISAPLANLQKSARVTDKISGRLKDFVFTGAYKPELIDVPTLIQDAIDLSKPQKPPHVTIAKEIAPELPKVQADSLWIEMLLKNLFVNAFTAIPDVREGLVTVTAEADESHLHLHVRDNGNGMDKELQQKVFKFGTSTKNDAVHKMHGVGLYHCYLIAQVHNGTLRLKSETGEGTTFSLSLPLASTEPPAQEGLVDA